MREGTSCADNAWCEPRNNQNNCFSLKNFYNKILDKYSDQPAFMAILSSQAGQMSQEHREIIKDVGGDINKDKIKEQSTQYRKNNKDKGQQNE